MQRAVDDLFTKPVGVGLFRPSPNAVDGGDEDHGDGYIPDTSRASTITLEMMKFVGHLMGISFRTKVGLPQCSVVFMWCGGAVQCLCGVVGQCSAYVVWCGVVA